MHELISQLLRLYLTPGAPAPDGLERHLAGQTTRTFDLVDGEAVRAIVIPFDWRDDGGGAGQWERLCAVANALQGELGLPAPAVSISGAVGFRLWLSFESPLPVETARHFLDLLRAAYFPEVAQPAGGGLAPVEFPPCRNAASGKWAAFIHPGMGASFADEPALEMAPPFAAQVAFLQGLRSIGAAQFQHALDVLQPALDVAQPAPGIHHPGPAHAAMAAVPTDGVPTDAVPPGLLLKDATLEDIVRYLHGKNIEPSFRHVLPTR